MCLDHGSVSYTHLEDGGRLAHQKSIGSKEKKMYNAAKTLEHRIAAVSYTHLAYAVMSMTQLLPYALLFAAGAMIYVAVEEQMCIRDRTFSVAMTSNLMMRRNKPV